jgi:hypothetical protein
MSQYSIPVEVSIAESGSLSGEVDLRGYELDAVLMPAAWTAANLTFQAAEASGGTFRDVHDDTGTEVTVTAAAARAIPIGTVTKRLNGLQFLKVRSGTSGSAVTQSAARTLTLMLKRRS